MAAGAARSVLLEADTSRRHFRPTSGTGIETLPAEPWIQLPESVALAYEILASGHARQIAPLATVLPDLALWLGTPAAIVAPVATEGQSIGLLVLATSAVVPALEWIDHVSACADGFALALARARLEQDVAMQRDADSLVTGLARDRAAGNDHAAIESFCAGLARLTGADRVTLWHHDRETRRLVVLAASDRSHARRPAAASTADTDALLVQVLRGTGVELLPVPAAPGRAPVTNAAVSLRGQRRALGVLVLQGLRLLPGDEGRVRERLERLGRQLSGVLEAGLLLDDVLRTRRELEVERSDLRERLAQSQALADLVAGIAHELNNPLQGVLGHVELMRRAKRVPAAFDAPLKRIHRDADRAARIVRNLLLLAGSGRLVLRPLQVNAAVTRALALRAAGLRRQHIAVQRSLATDLPRIRGDAVLLQQAMLNILVNAEQALAGRPDPSIFVRSLADAGRVIVEIRDNGPGVEAGLVARVFDPFVTTREGGSGLGLALTQRIIREHGGEVTAGNHASGGAVFTVSLPALAVVE